MNTPCKSQAWLARRLLTQATVLCLEPATRSIFATLRLRQISSSLASLRYAWCTDVLPFQQFCKRGLQKGITWPVRDPTARAAVAAAAVDGHHNGCCRHRNSGTNRHCSSSSGLRAVVVAVVAIAIAMQMVETVVTVSIAAIKATATILTAIETTVKLQLLCHLLQVKPGNLQSQVVF